MPPAAPPSPPHRKDAHTPDLFGETVQVRPSPPTSRARRPSPKGVDRPPSATAAPVAADIRAVQRYIVPSHTDDDDAPASPALRLTIHKTSHPKPDLHRDAFPLTPNRMLHLLEQWADAGLLRRLDVALARLLHGQCPQTPACALWAAAVLSHLEGRGHTCLPLAELIAQPQSLLAWPTQHPASAAALAQLSFVQEHLPRDMAQWRGALLSSPLVRTGAMPDAAQPLVLVESICRLAETTSPGAGHTADAAHAGDDALTTHAADGHASGALLYLRRYWLYERTVAQQLLQRMGVPPGGEGPVVGSADTTPEVHEPTLRHWLDRLFPPAKGTEDGAQGFNWQKLACALALRARLGIITGGPGTGKTYTAARLLALLFITAKDASRLRVALAAPTGKAAARLKQSIDTALHGVRSSLEDAPQIRDALDAGIARTGAARTLHALLGARTGSRHLLHNAAHPLDVDVLIVDEASMIHLEMMAALLQALPPTARLVLLGDKDQLASVEAGSVLGDLCRDAQTGQYAAQTVDWAQRVTGQCIPAAFHAARAQDASALAQHTVMLRTSRRFGGPIGHLARHVNHGQVNAALQLLHLSQGKEGSTPEHESAHTTDRSPEHVATSVPDLACIAPATLAQVCALALHGRDAAGIATAGTTDATAPRTASYAAYVHALEQWPKVLQAMQNASSAQDAAHIHGQWVRQAITAFEQFRLLCAVREGDWGVQGLNQAIEQALRQQARLVRSRSGSAASPLWYPGRPVMVTRNDATLGVFNGDIGIALPAAPPQEPPGDGPSRQGNLTASVLRVYFLEGDSLRSIATARLPHVQTAFAMTVHKSQGSEFAHAALVLPPVQAGMTRELLYTGITRARQHLTLLLADPAILGSAIRTPTRRSSGL